MPYHAEELFNTLLDEHRARPPAGDSVPFNPEPDQVVQPDEVRIVAAHDAELRVLHK